jgi:hypothetical protein
VGLRFDRDRDVIEKILTDCSMESGFSDVTIAAALNVSAVTVGNWRRRLGIPISSKFFAHFEEYYGVGAVAEFRMLLKKGTSYAQIGKHFGFSRQRAFQIAQEHFARGAKDAQEEEESGSGTADSGSSEA